MRAGRAIERGIKEKAAGLGFDLAGVAPAIPAPHFEEYEAWVRADYAGDMGYMTRDTHRRESPEGILPGARSVVVVGLSYFTGDPPPGTRDDPSRGRVSRYAWGADYHDRMLPPLKELASFIQSETGARFKVCLDTAPLLEREFAALGGLGFIGRNSTLISPAFGSWLFLGEIVLDVELEPESPSEECCGPHCHCMEECPTGAIVAPRVVDARRCISYLTIEHKGSIPPHLRPLIGNRVFGCDTCQEACPWNLQAGRQGRQDFLRYEPGIAAPELSALMSLSGEGFRAVFRDSPISRIKRRGLLRNAAVALGNWGDGAAIPPLLLGLSDHEPLVRGHSAWGLGRVGGAEARRALELALGHETSTEVAREIGAAIAESYRSG